MKLFYLIITFAFTFALMFATSSLLDISWIQNHWIRPFLLYVIMFFEFLVGMAIIREIIQQD